MSLLQGMNGWGAQILLEVNSVLLTFLFAYFRGFVETAIRAIWELIIDVHGGGGHLAAATVGPLAIGLVSAGAWYLTHKLSHRVTGGHVTGLDTVAFAIFGYIGRVPAVKYGLFAYAWNWIKCVLFVGAIFGGCALGALTSQHMIKGNPINGAMLPHASLLGREGYYFLLPLILETVFVMARLYLANPMVDAYPSAAGIASMVVGGSAIIGGYIGNNGHYDFILPLAIAAVGGQSVKFFGFAVLGWLGALICGILIFALVGVQHVAQNTVFKNHAKRT